MFLCSLCFFFFKQKTAYEMLRSLVGSEMCIRDRLYTGILVKDSVKPRRLYGGAILLGAVIGVGYGFRQDVFVCLPLALFCILAASRPVCALSLIHI